MFCEERTSLSNGRLPLRHLKLGRLLQIKKMLQHVSENMQILFEKFTSLRYRKTLTVVMIEKSIQKVVRCYYVGIGGILDIIFHVFLTSVSV